MSIIPQLCVLLQLRGRSGIKDWSSYYVPDPEGPQIKSFDGWVRTFTLSEYTGTSYESQVFVLSSTELMSNLNYLVWLSN